MSSFKNTLEKLRDLVGLLKVGYIMGTGKPITQRMYNRYNIGDKVRYWNQDKSAWDVAEVTSVRNKDTYQLVNPDYDTLLVNWDELRPLD